MIKYEDYGWKFNEAVAEQFDEHVRKSVYMYDDFQKNIIKMSKFFIYNNSNVLDVGTSTGELLFGLHDDNFNCNWIGIDTELAMVNKAKKKLGDNFKIEVADILNYKMNNCSIITMMLVLQFIKNNEKQLAINNIYNALNKGGAFFFVDKIKTNISDINDLYNDIYYDFKIEKGFTFEEIINKNKSLRGVQKTITLEENIKLIKNAGFNKIDIFQKYNNFVGILAIK
ncbi:methyltransferase domain-containing protein [Clostridioides sp. ES-S-0049-02]|uniref:methyltransferase domain-containing protein n=1 Tax=Clostridioides sp. ES-S-0049-02 TaxID=2770778 RepID=UPI001D0F8A3B|nr:methyltransferase domain-containing protein [Clostridioides sp. ES-S-0049-02]